MCMGDVGQIDDKLAVYEEAFASHPVAIGKAISKMERWAVFRLSLSGRLAGSSCSV